jgi:Flp pilus assembly protein TadD
MNPIDVKYDEAMKAKEQGDLPGAVQLLEECLQIDPDHSLSHSALGVYLQKLGRFEEAIAHARRVTELEPNDPFSYSQLSIIYQRCGKIPEAEDAMARARMVQQVRGS